jgi:ribosomal protein S21
MEPAVSRITLHADAAVVHLEPRDSLDAALVRFKKRCTAAAIFQEITKRKFAMTRGAKRRAKSIRAAKRRARAARRQRGIDADWKPERSAS